MSFYPEAHAQFAEAVQFGTVEPVSPVVSCFPSSTPPEAGRPASNTAGDEGTADGPEAVFVSESAAGLLAYPS